MTKYEKYLESYFPCPSNQRDCLMAIVWEAWGVAERLEEFEPDYIQELIEIHSGKDSIDPADIIDEDIIVYWGVNTHISEDLCDFRNGSHHFLEAFYQQKENVIKLIEDKTVLNNVIEVISIFEVILKKLNDTFDNYHGSLCFYIYEGNLEELERRHGKYALRHYKKLDELTTKEFESAFEHITAFMNYINENVFSTRLMELGARIRVFCDLHLNNSKKADEVNIAETQRPITLIKFMQRYCEKQSLYLLKCRRKSLNDAHFRKSITLPEPTMNWTSGQAKYYKASDLKEKWPSYCEILPNLPPLKQSK